MLCKKILVQKTWAAKGFFALVKDGKMRFCLDRRKQNAVTKKDSNPISRMDECIDSLGEAAIFSTLGAQSGYWLVGIDAADRDKLASTSHHALYRFLCMLFGLKSAHDRFQRITEVILCKMRRQFALKYIEKIVIFTKIFTGTYQAVHQKPLRLHEEGVTLRLKKIWFFTETFDYARHVIRSRSLKIASQQNLLAG